MIYYNEKLSLKCERVHIMFQKLMIFSLKKIFGFIRFFLLNKVEAVYLGPDCWQSI